MDDRKNKLEFQIVLCHATMKDEITKEEDLAYLIARNHQIEDYQLIKNGINLKYQGEEIEIEIQKKETNLENMIFYLNISGNKGVLDSFRSVLLNIVDEYLGEKITVNNRFDRTAANKEAEIITMMDELEKYYDSYVF